MRRLSPPSAGPSANGVARALVEGIANMSKKIMRMRSKTRTRSLATRSTPSSNKAEREEKSTRRSKSQSISSREKDAEPSNLASSANAFDVFLSHNSKDKPIIRLLKRQLKDRGLNAWLDEDELMPGHNWQLSLEDGMRSSRAAAVLVASDGIGPWENEEIQALLQMATREKKAIIPVLLPGAPKQPNLPAFLTNRTWVDFRDGLSESGLDRLIWGITNQKPSSSFHWPAGVSNDLVREVRRVHTSEEVQRVVAKVLTHPEYPVFMAECENLIENPVWRHTSNAERLRWSSRYKPDGLTLPTVMRADLLLIRRNDKRGDGELLTYPSKHWRNTYLIHFRQWKPEDKSEDRNRMNALKFASKWDVPPESIHVNWTGKFAVSAKLNEETKTLWLYIFEFCFVHCTQWSEELKRLQKDGYTSNAQVERRGKWRSVRDMRNDPDTAAVDGDVVGAIHHFFDVNLGSLRSSFPD